ncbi:sensor histidine kinase [Paenibacillus sp. FSL H7-0331]|uniref:sensor histidine kinase n=1 Tax=Paenibacillus sp. FSL H7-0331 TaxID=1920421 RepID=UPI001181527E|nr:sensor histidine kinase [Paenibacillus sp. FSL H7-0331]
MRFRIKRIHLSFAEKECVMLGEEPILNRQVITLIGWISRFHDLKLRTKFLLSFIAVILVTVLLVVAVIYQVSIKTIKSNTSVYSQFLSQQMGINLDKRTRDFETFVFQQFKVSRLNLPGEVGSQEYEVEALFRGRNTNDFIAGLMLSQNYYQSVLFYDEQDRLYVAERSAGLNTLSKLPKGFNVNAIREKRGRASWLPGGSNLVFMAKSLYSGESSAYAGTVIVGIDSEQIRSIYTTVDELTQGSVLVLNEDNERLVQDEPMESTIRYFIEQRLFEQTADKQPTFELNGRDYIYTILEMPYEKWKIIQIISVDELTRGTVVIRFWTFTILIVALLLAFVMAAFLSRRITENVGLLLQSMSQLSVDFTPRWIVPKSRDEFGLLADRFNLMTTRINELINTVYKEQMMKQQAEYRTLQSEYRTLQAQFNPHFLYNTLETIHGLAKLKGDEQIGEMVYLLGSLLRESISRKGDVIGLKDEVAFVAKYLEIHRIMYEDKIEVGYEMAPDVMDCWVPKFILQPLVENSIVHGIEMKPGQGFVGIMAYREKDSLLLEVADNGMGMDAATVEALLEEDAGGAAAKPNHTRVGLLSVHKRIRMLYGEQFGLEISSQIGEGTKVRIRLPVLEDKEVETIEENSRGD